MNSFYIERTNGNIPKSLPGEDHISGLLAFIPYPQTSTDPLYTGFSTSKPIHLISSLESAESQFGITENHAQWEIKGLHYHLREIFRINPGIALYVGIYPNSDFNAVKQIQAHASGNIRQLGIWNPKVDITVAQLLALKNSTDQLVLENTPLIAIYATRSVEIDAIPTSLGGEGYERISVVVGEELDENSAPRKIYNSQTVTKKYNISSIGVVLGLISRAKVHESVSGIKKFGTSILKPGFGNGLTINQTSTLLLDRLEKQGIIYFKNYGGLSGTYINDSYTVGVNDNQFGKIENVRTMDKAVRNIRRYLSPNLGKSLYVDVETGYLEPYTIKYLENITGRALEDMEKAGEISGYIVNIDPEQNVVESGIVEIKLIKIGVGVLRHMHIRIGFAKRTVEEDPSEEEAE